MPTTDSEFLPIDVEQTDWERARVHLAAIAREIFTGEPARLTKSDLQRNDPDALYWLAYGTGRVPMGAARLQNGRLATVAVVPRFRRNNVGSTLLSHVIRHALARGLDILAIDARPEDMPFYKRLGCIEYSPMITAAVNTASRSLALALYRFGTPRVIATPPPIAAKNRLRVPLKNAAEFNQAALALAANATRKVHVLSDHLDPKVYDNGTFSDRILDFAISRRDTEIHILLRDPHTLVQTGHRLLQLHRRLPSRIKIRRCNPNCQTPHREMMLIDGSGILYNQSADGYSGYAVHHSPADAAALARAFHALWAAGETDTELREMPI